MVKKNYILTLAILCLTSLSVFSQISEGGLPPSFAYPSNLRSTTLPNYRASIDFDVKRLKWEDEKSAENGAIPRIAIDIPININIDSTGTWTLLADSSYIWRQTVTADNAVGLILSYSDFYIPEGGKLYIYNQEKSHILGAYTHQTHRKGGSFATEPIYGESFTLEYVASPISEEKPRIVVESIGYIYNEKSTFASINSPESQINTPNADSWRKTCRINVNCPEGKNWQNQKRGVVLLYIKYYRQWAACSGSLINNTAQDGKPYVLTASHCFEDAIDVNLNQLIVNFNYEFSTCDNQTVVPEYQSLVGVEKLVHIPLAGGSDNFLFKINEDVPKEWNPYYNGWDRSNNASQSGVVIHHPYWDVKKITTYVKPVTSSTYVETGKTGAPNGHWQVVYDGNSVTERGSSGSPIFNQNGLITGVLTGGTSYCESPYNPDLFGKLWYGWDQYPDNTNGDIRLQVYLDPLNKGVQSLEGYDPNGTSGIEDYLSPEIEELVIFPNPADNELNINADGIIRSVEVYDIQGRKIFFKSGYTSSTTQLSVSSWNNGMYNVRVKTENRELTGKLIKK